MIDFWGNEFVEIPICYDGESSLYIVFENSTAQSQMIETVHRYQDNGDLSSNCPPNCSLIVFGTRQNFLDFLTI